jgi:GNAT superfamily N-acetyltransferase
MNIEYVEYNETEHLDQLVKLERHLWENQTEDELKAIFKWKYRKKYDFSNAFVALENDRLIAFRGFFINRYKVLNDVYPIAVFSDAVTHPKYRGRGVFSKLSNFGVQYLKENGIIGVLALSSNNKSSPGYLKLGAKALAEKETSFRFIYTNAFYGKTHRLSNFNNRLAKKHLKIAVFEGLTENLAKELSTFSAKHQTSLITLDKNISFWINRYAAPHFHYKFCLLYKKESLLGYVVCREVHTTKLSHVKILDIDFVNPKYLEILIKSVDYHTSCKIMTMYTTCFNSEGILNVRKMFPFKQKGSFKNVSSCILLKNISEVVDDTLLFDKKNWILNYIDLDNM